MSELEKHSEETRESWQEQRSKIESLGSIKDIVSSKELLLQILTYSGDRHLIGQFYDMLNEALKNGEVLPEDLELLRSGWLGDCIVKLNMILETMGRKAYPFEKGDKLNYTTGINDTETQIATFTHPKIIASFAEVNYDNELSYCEQSLAYLSVEARLRIAVEVIKAGNKDKGVKMLTEINEHLASERKNDENARRESQGRI